MSVLTCKQIRTLPQGGVEPIYIDWGENTAGSKTGALSAGDTVSSCTVAVETKPSTDSPTFGSVTVPANASSDTINGRQWSTGEATLVTVTAASSLTKGQYTLKFTATTTNGFTLVRYVVVMVGGA